MKLEDMIAEFGLETFTPPADCAVDVTRGYASDLLSDVIANAERDCVWATLQTHVNVVAVAALKDVAAVVLVGGRKPDAAAVVAARDKGVCLLGTALTSFEICGRLYASGVRGVVSAGP